MDHAARPTIRAALLLLGLLGASSPAPAPAAEPPAKARQDYGVDPATGRRYGPAYRYPQSGWIVLHIEGEPYDRGYQHGRLMAPEIADQIRTLAARQPWHSARTIADALFLRRYDKELLEEMKGTADGASAAGATFEGRPVDLLDIVAINSEIEAEFLEPALGATAEGLEGKRFRAPSSTPPTRPKAPEADHCSAFMANGPATVDGSIVFGHITMWGLATARHFNVWLDVKPAKGHRVLMQTYPGGIQSGLDYYLNDAGLVVAETTIGQTGFDPEGEPLASRIRRALQYADSIDGAIAILSERNNGLYSNEWLLADTKTNEIAMFELGTRRSKLWRSSQGEWFGGTEGFYWGCNNAKDRDVRLETVASFEGRPSNVVWHASDRDAAWVALFRANRGKVDAGFAERAFATPPLASASSLDAKFTTTAMARELKTRALFGPPMGSAWLPTEADRQRNPTVRPLVPNDWTTLTADAPSLETRPAAVDFAATSGPSSNPTPDAPAWHGTILPEADADAWLAAAFADYERIVALEASQGRAGRDPVALALFGARTRYLAAVRRLGSEAPLAKTQPDPGRGDWYEVAAGKGVLLLAALRDQLGAGTFAAMMDEFGRAHAGRAVAVSAFIEHAEEAAGRSLAPFFSRWLDETGLPDDRGEGTWAVDSFQEEPETALIAYGTLRDVQANREAADRLRQGIARRWSNVLVPIKADSELTEEDWKSRHLLLVGRPEANAATARCSKGLPVAFGLASFTLRGETYAHPGTAVIAAGPNPTTARFSVVVFAGLGADATWHCVENLPGRREPHPAVILIPQGSPARWLAAGRAR